jgi:Glycosyltransferase family 87
MMKRVFFVLASMLLAGSMWIWVQDITIARQQKEARELGIPRGNLSDLYPRWLGARELLLRGRNPYGRDITREIQTGYYGRPIDAQRPNDPKDQQAFAYPLYVVFVLAPSVRLPFPIVQRGFLWLLVGLTAISVLLWFHALRWRVSLTTKLVWIVLVLGCFPALQAFKLQQLTLLVAALLAGAMAAIIEEQFVLAGILLALASIKPQLVGLTAIWLMIWTLGNWRQRQRLFWSGSASMMLLLVGSEILLPGWIHDFRDATSAYYQYTGGGRSLLDMALTTIGGKLAATILIAVLVVLLWRVRRETEGSAAFQWSLAAVLATTLVIIPMFAPYNQVLLVPCLMLVAKEIRKIWKEHQLSRFFLIITAGSVAWPWIAATALTIALLLLPASTVERAWWLPLTTTLMIPFALLGLVFVSGDTISAPRPQ